MLGTLLRKIRDERGWTLDKVVEEYKRRNPDNKKNLWKSNLSDYELGRNGLSKKKAKDIFVYAFGYTSDEADTLISSYIVETNWSNLTPENQKALIKKTIEIENSIFGDKSVVGKLQHKNIDAQDFIPVYSSIAAGFLSSNLSSQEEYMPTPPDIKYAKERLFYAKIEGKCMEPDIQNGDLVLVLKDGFDMENGKIYVVLHKNEYSLKEYRKITDDVYELRVRNRDMESENIMVTKKSHHDVHVVGRVLKVTKDL